MTLTPKQELVKRLIEMKYISFEESLLLLDYNSGYYPYTIPSINLPTFDVNNGSGILRTIQTTNTIDGRL